MTKKPSETAHFAVLSKEDINALNKALTSTQNEHRNRAVIFLGLGAGLQLSEICHLKLDDVSVRGKVTKVIQVGPKEGGRQVVLSAQSRAYLEKHLEALVAKKPDHLVFGSPTNPSQPIPTQSLSVMFLRLGKKLKMPQLSFTSFRKTHAVALRKMGIDKAVIRNQLGLQRTFSPDKYIDTSPENDDLAIEFLKF